MFAAEDAGLARMDEMLGAEQKQPQSTVGYREGTPQQSCGVCANFLGGEDAMCRVVEGPVAMSGVCDRFEQGDGDDEQVLAADAV